MTKHNLTAEEAAELLTEAAQDVSPEQFARLANEALQGISSEQIAAISEFMRPELQILLPRRVLH